MKMLLFSNIKQTNINISIFRIQLQGPGRPRKVIDFLNSAVRGYTQGTSYEEAITWTVPIEVPADANIRPRHDLCSEPIAVRGRRQVAAVHGSHDVADIGTGDWRTWDIEPVVRRKDDGLSRKLDADRLRALGNAVVPQQIYPLLEAIYKEEMKRKSK